MKNMYELKEELNLKAQRVTYWEIFGHVPNMNDLASFNDARLEV